MDYKRKHGRDDNVDTPVHSRLFIVCERKVKEQHFRESFSKFGNIEDIRMPRDRDSGEPRGVAYIKFSKTSEAADALEAMHHKLLPNTSRPLKVMVAANRSDIQMDDEDDDKYKRLFITVPKCETEDQINNEFSAYGHIDSITLLRNRDTGEPKGFAYVRFQKFSGAARAIEGCNRKYKPVFATPKGHNKRQETAFENSINSIATSSVNRTSLMSMMNTKPHGYTRLNFMCCPNLTHRHVESVFDIVPGLIDCQYFVDLFHNFGKGIVSYSNPISAAYAVEKLNEFEYPPGMKFFVKPNNSQFDVTEQTFSAIPNVVSNLKNAINATSNSNAPDLAKLAEAIAEASKLIKMATTGISDDNIPDSNDLNYCNIKLPPPQPLADIDSPVAKRCFLVCKPHPPPLTVLRDIFCRFGNLINVYTLPQKTVGYARYASVEAADNAIKTLHGAEICGVRIKVLEADEEAPAKKMRYSE